MKLLKKVMSGGTLTHFFPAAPATASVSNLVQEKGNSIFFSSSYITYKGVGTLTKNIQEGGLLKVRSLMGGHELYVPPASSFKIHQ